MTLQSEAVRREMEKLGVIPLKADFTRKDPVISAWLRRFGRAGVPMYVVIPADPGREAFVLSEVITPASVIEALRQATGATRGS